LKPISWSSRVTYHCMNKRAAANAIGDDSRLQRLDHAHVVGED
jgi:hypothetical protein